MSTKENSASSNILRNIEAARAFVKNNDSVRGVAVVSGNEVDRENWHKRLDEVSSRLFNGDGSTLVMSLEERIGRKIREGNFLGTLLAYRYIREVAGKKGVPYKDFIVLLGMLFGRGERLSPITQAKGCRKPGTEVAPADVENGSGKRAFTAIEEALLYFTPVARYLEKRGFRGVLDKWGDETEIASVDLTKEPGEGGSMAEYDAIKVISVMEITDELARQKDWVVFDDDDNMVGQLSRNEKDVLIEQLKGLGIKPRDDGKYYAGISLGPVAVSYDVLDIAEEVFADEITREDVYFDFDPYFLMALAMDNDQGAWDAAVREDKDLQKLVNMVPDLFEKVQRIKTIFADRYGRCLNLKILDLGSDLYWSDIGQHTAMREKFLSFNDRGTRGLIARKIANIPDARDKNGNIIVNSEISRGVTVMNSVLVNCRVTGKGTITGSVIIDSELNDVEITGAFAVRSVRSGSVVLKERSGIFESLGDGDLTLEEGMRHVSVLTSKGKADMKVSEDTNLRDKDNTYNVPIFGNNVSFDALYDEMFGVSMEELEMRRTEAIKELERI